MPIVRFISSLIPAIAVTFGLLTLMHVLISANLEEPEPGDPFKIPEIVMPERELQVELDIKAPEKPDEQEEPPPEIPEPEFQDTTVETTVSIRPTVAASLEIGGMGGFGGDGDYLPIVKVAAKYPSRALSRGTEGYCTVQYTVTTSGGTRDVAEYDCPNKVFLRSSIKAAGKFKYKPKVVNGEAIEVPGVVNKFTFELAKD